MYLVIKKRYKNRYNISLSSEKIIKLSKNITKLSKKYIFNKLKFKNIYLRNSAYNKIYELIKESIIKRSSTQTPPKTKIKMIS